MKLLHWHEAGQYLNGIAVLFGTGLVGGAVERAVRQAVNPVVQKMSYDWSNAETRRQQSQHIEQAVIARAAGMEHPQSVAVIWAAGQSGFGSTREEMQQELETLKDVLALAERLAVALPQAVHCVHHVSSSGGLFEGQVACGPKAVPRPLRPYGFGKILQEQAVIAMSEVARRHIYRLTSVYGHNPSGRAGLIPTLMTNAIKRRPSYIQGSLSTLRDYVLAEDVGRFMARNILLPGDETTCTHLIAQGRPASIFEIVQMVKKAVNMPLHLQIDPHPSNARSMSFLPSATPGGWRPTPLPTGIALVAQDVRLSLL